MERCLCTLQGIDEISSRPGHDYVSLFMDLDDHAWCSPRGLGRSHDWTMLPIGFTQDLLLRTSLGGAMRKDLVVGADFGTEGVRVGLFDLAGGLKGYATEPYRTVHPGPAAAEQDPQEWWSAFVSAMLALMSDSGVSPDQIVGLGFDATSCSVVFCNASGELLRPAIIWMDVRAAAEASEIGHSGSPALRYQAGPSASAEWMPAKALWVKRHEPEVFEQADVVCEFVDWIGFRLTGRWTASLNNITARWYYQGRRNGWPEDLYTAIGLDDVLELFPEEILPLGKPHGELMSEVADAIGLKSGTTVAQGGADAFVAMLGLDVAAPGRVALITGSSHLQLALSEHSIYPSGLFGGFPDAVVPGLAMIEGGQVSTGSIANWFRGVLRSGDGAIDYRKLDEAASSIDPGADGLVMLDCWQGNRTPYTDPEARGVLWGMTLGHEVGHVWRAILEGVAYGTAQIIDVMRKAGIPTEEIIVCGGACNSPFWLQIHADVTGLPLTITKVPEAACLGSATLAAVAGHAFSSLPEASSAMVSPARVVEPDPSVADVYDFYLDRYIGTYDALKDEMHEMVRWVGSRSEQM
jgi:ribulokinase